MHTNDPKDLLKSLSPMGRIVDVQDIVDAVLYLTEAGQVRCCTSTEAHMSGSGSSKFSTAEGRLRESGIHLPPPPKPLGVYVPAVQTGNLLFLSGMLPMAGREPKVFGRLGKEIDIEAGRDAARIAALNALAVVRQHLGSLDRVSGVVRLGVSIATWGDFSEHVKVADSASELFRDIYSARIGCPRD